VPNGGVEALVFDSERTASIGVEKLVARVPGVLAPPRPTREVLTRLLAAGVTRLNVNSGFTTERWYGRAELARMLALVGEPERVAAPAPASEVATVPRRSTAADALAWLRRHPARPMLPPPGRSDADAERAFGALRTRLDKQAVSIHEYVRLLAHDVDFYVQANPAPREGLRWPQRFETRRDGASSALHAYTREATMVAQVSTEAPELRGYLRLAGVELMRWAWASPLPADVVYVDGYPGTAGALSLPLDIALQFLYPLFREVESIESVPSVGLARVSALPGAHALRPEAARALLTGWKHVLDVKARAADAPACVEHDGGRWLPAFTTDEQFFDYGRKHRAFDGVPARAEAQAPFGRWLAAVREADGVVLDPGAPRPLTLDHTTLLALDVWSREGRQPRATDLVAAAARHLADGVITARQAGRAVADWPRWYVAAQQSTDGVAGIRMREADALPLFATANSCMAFVDHHRRAGIVKGEWKAVPIPHRWRVSVFHEATDAYADGAWLEPAADGTGGFHVHGAMLEAAVERLHEMLTPRVPGFVASA
jgi:hypothetical protein